MPPREWDASSYDRMSDPQLAMARDVIDRLDLRGDERVLDAGCGTGRVTEVLAQRVPDGTVIAVDGSAAMVEQTRARGIDAFTADLAELELDEPVDAILSTATFHWIADHDRLFGRLRAALRPGGRLVAQCGGAGNVTAIHAAAEDAAALPAFASHFAGWAGPWNFAGAEETRARLARAGFPDAETWLQPRPVVPDDPREWLRTIVLGSHLERLPGELRDAYVDAV